MKKPTWLLSHVLYFKPPEGVYGQTVGKMGEKIKIRAVREGGERIEHTEAAVRNILRAIEVISYFIAYLLGASRSSVISALTIS